MSENLRMLMSGLNYPTFSTPRFGLNSILDILFLTYVIYKVMIWIKRGRAWTLLKGLVVVLIIYVAAYFLGLDTAVWIMNKVASAALIAIVVIFQPELRKALEKLGKGRLVTWVTLAQEHGGELTADTISELVDATSKMAKARTGALIVIEQAVELSDLETTGIAIDARVTSQLLINIFEDKTPLHDGAVVIRGNRLAAATCILPLTQDQLSSELGTRHRAAVGVSEVSDAYVLVVSEETGGISIAKEGKLYRHLSSDDVRRMLSEGLKPTKAVKTFGWKGRRKNEKA